MSLDTEIKYRVKVNHNGACGDYTFKQNEPVDLPVSIINSLGNHVTFIDNNGNTIPDPR